MHPEKKEYKIEIENTIKDNSKGNNSPKICKHNFTIAIFACSSMWKVPK